MKKRVVVTGLGMVTPIGNDVETSWKNLLRGVSGAGPITSFDCSASPVKICAPVKGLDAAKYLSEKDIKKLYRFMIYGLVAGIQAVEDSNLMKSDLDMDRVGVSMGSGIGGLEGIEETTKLYLERGARRVSPFFVPHNIINLISGRLSIMHGFKGPNLAIVTACTTGTHNIGNAARLISYGDADVMLVGGSEMAITPTGVAGFANAKALSTRNDSPEKASRPWDKARNGFVLGDGAGALVLESYEHAKKRGANIYAELIGYGMSSDAFHITAPDEKGEGAALCMKNALADAEIPSSQVDYINAHGTSTPAGDRAETAAMHLAFGDAAGQVAISSSKSMIGHLLGAAGAVEAIFSILSIRDRIVPPTINLDTPGDGCDLDYVPHVCRKQKVDVSMSNSFGFGGTNGTLIFRRF